MKMTMLLHEDSERLRKVWAIRNERLRAGSFPLSVEEAAEIVTGLGYKEESSRWYQMVWKLSRVPVGELRRSRSQFQHDEGGDPGDDGAPGLSMDIDSILKDAGL